VLLPVQDFSSITPDPSIGVVLYGFQSEQTLKLRHSLLRSLVAMLNFLLQFSQCEVSFPAFECVQPCPPPIAATDRHPSPPARVAVNYKQLAKAYNYLALNKNCRLVLTNDDQSLQLPNGGLAPGEGAIASVLLGARKGLKPIIVGKPHQPILDEIRKGLHFDPARTVMYGDRLETGTLSERASKHAATSGHRSHELTLTLCFYLRRHLVRQAWRCEHDAGPDGAEPAARPGRAQ